MYAGCLDIPSSGSCAGVFSRGHCVSSIQAKERCNDSSLAFPRKFQMNVMYNNFDHVVDGIGI